MGERLMRWFLFSVLVSLVPLAFSYIQRMTDGTPITFAAVVSHGELLLISAALAAPAIGELIVTGSGKAILKILSIGGSVLTLLAASLYFAHVSSAAAVKSSVVLKTSLWLFGFGLVSNASCIALSGHRRVIGVAGGGE